MSTTTGRSCFSARRYGPTTAPRRHDTAVPGRTARSVACRTSSAVTNAIQPGGRGAVSGAGSSSSSSAAARSNAKRSISSVMLPRASRSAARSRAIQAWRIAGSFARRSR